MSSQAVNRNALEATTSIEDITGNENNQDILRSLKNDELSELWLYRLDPDVESYGENDYELGSSRELDWLGHFAKKSTRLESIGIFGAFGNCSGHSVERFLGDLGKCSHLKKMYFTGLPAEIIHKLGLAMKNNSRTHFAVEECYLGVPEATFLFNTFRDMNSLEELCIDGDDEEGIAHLNDDDMAGCIPSLAACTGMRSLKLNYLNLSTNSCAALRGVFPRMATLHFQTSVDALYLASNDITLARHVLLLRFRVLNIVGNALCPGGTRVIASSLANPECRLEYFNLNQCNIGGEGMATLADGLRNNQRLTYMSLDTSNITERGWNAFSSILCDTSSINATYNSNHTLQSLRGFGVQIPQDVRLMLDLNQGKDKSGVAASKILQAHRHLDMRPLFGRELGLLPYVVAWLDHFAESRPDLKLSSIFDFVRAMPMKVVNGLQKLDLVAGDWTMSSASPLESTIRPRFVPFDSWDRREKQYPTHPRLAPFALGGARLPPPPVAPGGSRDDIVGCRGGVVLPILAVSSTGERSSPSERTRPPRRDRTGLSPPSLYFPTRLLAVILRCVALGGGKDGGDPSRWAVGSLPGPPPRSEPGEPRP
ncbi:hypothetical protein THAOC_37382, partial [Thalassiosira oceanica]